MNKKLNILIVDDEHIARTIICEKLKGHNITECKDGYEAWMAISIRNYDLIITDLQMPEMNGIQLIKKIRKANNLTHAIMVTAFSYDIPEQVRNDDTLFSAILQKPVLPGVLEKEIEKIFKDKI